MYVSHHVDTCTHAHVVMQYNTCARLSPADFQHKLIGPASTGMEIHCMCLCCSHTVHMGHECFLPTAAEDIKKSMTHSSVVSDGAILMMYST